MFSNPQQQQGDLTMFRSMQGTVGLLAASFFGLVPVMKAGEMPPPKAPEVKTQPLYLGVWSQRTTLALIRGRWLDEKQYQRFQETDNPDLFLAAFSPTEAHQLAALALEIGFPVLRESRSQPGQGVAVAERPVELLCHIQQVTARGKRYYQPIIQVRLTRLQLPAAQAPRLPAVQPGPPPGIPQGLAP
jgi:hypothetical protein